MLNFKVGYSIIEQEMIDEFVKICPFFCELGKMVLWTGFINFDNREDIMLSFEAACKYWETSLADFIKSFGDNNILVLKNAKWEITKYKVKVCPPEEDGRKKRCRGLTYHTNTLIDKNDIGIIWGRFKLFCKEQELNEIERWSNNEEMGRYVFWAKNTTTDDEFKLGIYLRGEWNPRPNVSLFVWVNARYRNADLS